MASIFYTSLLIHVSTLIHVNVDAFAPTKVRPFRPQSFQLSSTVEQSILRKDLVTPKQLLSPEERMDIESLVNQRSNARWDGNFSRADEIRLLIDDITVGIAWRQILRSTNTTLDEEGDSLFNDLDELQKFKVVITDFPRSDGGGSTWELTPIPKCISEPAEREDNVLQLAHAALGMVVSMSEQGMNVNEEEFNQLINRAKYRLKVLRNRKAIANFLPEMAGCELHGRKAADAILWFALAGVTDLTTSSNDAENSYINLFDELVDIATEELMRFGSNNSCRAKDILHIVERIAMSGHTGPAVQRLYNVAAGFLEAKTNHYGLEVVDDSEEENDSSIDYQSIAKSLRDSSFGLHSIRPLLGLWRFSTRQRKQKTFFQNAARHYHGTVQDGRRPSESTYFNQLEVQYDWSKFFDDPSRPLVVDVGCGMGVSLLGLASECKAPDDSAKISDNHAISIDWEAYNFLGVDLSRLGIRYADGVCTRWGLSSQLKFVVDSAERCLSKIRESYPGNVELVMVQFPTPFRFKSSNVTSVEKGCNSQLPQDAASNDFMVTENLLFEIHKTLAGSGKLLIQSNCEDVAVHILDMAVRNVGFKPLTFSLAVTEDNFDKLRTNVPKRALDWQADGGKRAIGGHWSFLPLLPKHGRTETEVACILDSKPVHRCVLKPK